MAINKKLIHFKSKENFDTEVANGNILDNSIVFIQDSKEISTHGTVYKTVNWSVLGREVIPGGPVIDTTGKANGVYVVTAEGELVDKSAATLDCIGVAFISNNQKVMIPKANASDGTNIILYWGKNLYGQDVPNLENLTDTTAAKADYNGKANTAAIIAGYAALGKDMDSQDMCKVLETFNEGGYTDWYVPAAGQLQEFYSNKTAINAALTAINGIAFMSNRYWSSSEKSSGHAWFMDFDYNQVNGTLKSYNYCYVRFVRDLQ